MSPGKDITSVVFMLHRVVFFFIPRMEAVSFELLTCGCPLKLSRNSKMLPSNSYVNMQSVLDCGFNAHMLHLCHRECVVPCAVHFWHGTTKWQPKKSSLAVIMFLLRGIVAWSLDNPVMANCTSASAAIKCAQPLNIKLLILQSFLKLNSDRWKYCGLLPFVSLWYRRNSAMICRLISSRERFLSAPPPSASHLFKCHMQQRRRLSGSICVFPSKANNNETGPQRRFVIFLSFSLSFFLQITAFLFIPLHIKTLLWASQGVLPSLIFTWIVNVFYYLLFCEVLS